MALPKRKNIRLKDYDYSRNGAYFITICTKDKKNLLWHTVGAPIARPQETPHLSDAGIIDDAAINNIPICYPNITVDKYVIMPNHIHLILMLTSEGGRMVRTPTISTVINQMKGFITKQAGVSLWQKLFYEHIIRNEKEYQKVWEYIDTNPLKWQDDCYYES